MEVILLYVTHIYIYVLYSNYFILHMFRTCAYILLALEHLLFFVDM